MTTGTDSPRLLLVGMGMMGRPYVRRAQVRGYAVSVVDDARGLAPEPVRRMWNPADRTYEVTGTDDESWYAAASRAVGDARPDAVLAFSEYHVMAAAMVADELGLPSPGLRAATVSRNKLLQRATFGRHGIPQPEHHLAADADAALGWSADRLPVVLKPLRSTGSSGVRIVRNEVELKEWVAEAFGGQPFLCEELVHGPEFSVEVVVGDSVVRYANVTGKLTTPEPYCVEMAHRIPAGCAPETAEALRAQATQVVAALGMRDGIAHVESRVAATGPTLMEVAVRTPGDHIMELVDVATGVDLYDAAVAVACGQEPAVTPTRADAAAVWYPRYPADAEVPVEALRAAAAMPGVVRGEVHAKPGQSAPPLRWSLDRVASFLVRAPDVPALDALVDELRTAVGAVDDR